MDGQMNHQTNCKIDGQTDKPSKRDALLQKAKKIVKHIVNCSSPSKEQVEQSSAIRCDFWRYGSIDVSLTVHFTSNSNAQNVSV